MPVGICTLVCAQSVLGICVWLCVFVWAGFVFMHVCVLCVMIYMWGGGGVLCLGGVSASGCLSLSIPSLCPSPSQ